MPEDGEQGRGEERRAYGRINQREHSRRRIIIEGGGESESIDQLIDQSRDMVTRSMLLKSSRSQIDLSKALQIVLVHLSTPIDREERARQQQEAKGGAERPLAH